MRLEFSLRHVPWRSPLAAAHGDGGADTAAAAGARRTRPLLLVRLEDRDGACGYGEAAPLAAYDGVSVREVMAALGVYQQLLASPQWNDPEQLGDRHTAILKTCVSAVPLRQAIAALDMALWDLEGRRNNKPIWELLGATDAPLVEVNATIGADEPLVAGAEAAMASASGFRTFKVKVGSGDDLARVQAVRSAVGQFADIRIDANGAWSVTEAVSMLRSLAPHGLEYCEEPVHGVDQLLAVGEAVPMVDISADESAIDATLYETQACAAVCLKVARCGGITGVLREVLLGQQAGYELYLASTLDGPLGIAAALHVAAAFSPVAACGLATLDRFDAPDVIPVHNGFMTPPDGPGLGDGLLEWY